MPVQIQCTSVIIRNVALDRVLEGGSADFGSIAPNAMSYSDDCLSQASFMSSVDAEEYAKSLELRGLNRNQRTPDFVIVQAHDQSIEPPCDWLILFEYEQRLIATLRGSDSRTVIAPATDAHSDPNSIQHYSPEEVAEKLEFVERNGNIDTYREKATGKLVYHTRTTETADETFRRAFDVVWNHRREHGRPAKSGSDATEIEAAIASLQSLAAQNPDIAKVSLAMGMAWFAIGKEDKAQRHLTRAAELAPESTMVFKELAGVCLVRNNLPQALEAATQAVAIEPEDSDALGNLAVIQLVSGDAAAANRSIQHALQLQPNDQVNANIQSIVAAVVKGERPCPTTLKEMMQPHEPKKSWLARLLGR